MSNSLSEQTGYLRSESMQRSNSIADDSAQQALRIEALQGLSLFFDSKRTGSHDSHHRHSADDHHSRSERSSHSHRHDRRSRLFDKDSEYQAEQARNKRFKKYERFDHFKDGEEITRESVNKRLPESEALSKLRERAKEPKEGAGKEERLAAREAQVELEMYCEANYRRVKYHGDAGLIAYSNEEAGKARDNSIAQDDKNKCGHFKHMMKQIAGYGFNNGYSVVMGWMTSPGHRAELLKLSNKSMGASQINVASTINFDTAIA